MTTRGGQGPRDDGPVPVAFCMPRRHRHPELHCFRRSIPRLYAPLSTLRVLPRGSIPRMTRGQCGSLLLHCDGLSPSTSCRSSRRTAAQYLARGLPCERFTAALASRASCITRGRGGWLNLPRGGLPPPILCQLFLAHAASGQSGGTGGHHLMTAVPSTAEEAGAGNGKCPASGSASGDGTMLGSAVGLVAGPS